MSIRDVFQDAVRKGPVKGFMLALSVMQGVAVRCVLCPPKAAHDSVDPFRSQNSQPFSTFLVVFKLAQKISSLAWRHVYLGAVAYEGFSTHLAVLFRSATCACPPGGRLL